MKSKFTVIWATLLFLTQACAPTSKPVPPASSDSPTATSQSDSSAPIVETTMPQVEVSTAVAASTSQPLTQLLATETPSTGSDMIPAEGITRQDNGKTFTMKVGDSFLLNLGADIYDWNISVDNESVLRVKMGVLVIQGAQGIYEALTSGTATLTAVGNPRCLQSNPPCAIPSILFRVTVIVE